MNKGYLILEDGSKYEGNFFGKETESNGEVVFNTGMTGYPESFTDPSYAGQILTLTFPLIGNYGVPGNEKDRYGIKKNFESDDIHIKGLIVTEYCKKPNHWNKKQTLDAWLKEHNVPALSEIDTRALTQKLREKGTMLGKIVRDVSSNFKFHDPNKDNLVASVSIKKPKIYKGGKKKVVLIDCGCKFNILRSLLKKNVTVIRVPWNYDFFETKEKFHGIFISNGPGDPGMLTETHSILKKAIRSNVPVFGICLGAQLLGIAAGAKTYKLKYGHRAQNQPCMEINSRRCFITAQNHGFAIRKNSLPRGWETWFVNANDKTVEGIKHKTKPVSAVQFHPEATPGPTDTNYLIDEFIKSL